MARELRRLLIDPGRLRGLEASGGALPLLPQEEHYLTRVLRLRCGEPVAVIDGCGGLWRARRGDDACLVELEASVVAAPAASPRLTLALALPRQDVDMVWRMATELGIDRLQPLVAERCHPGVRRQPRERWQAIVREATEQCERLWLPELCPLAEARDWLAGQRSGQRLLATTRLQQLPLLESALLASRPEAQTGELSLAVGPEGGWSPDEERLAEAAGWRAVSLGGTILRCSTAAVAAASRLTAWRQLSCAPCCGPSPGIPPDPPHLDGADAAGSPQH